MVDSIGLNKINAIPSTRTLVHKKTEKSKRDPEKKGRHSSSEDKEQKRVGINIDERC